MATAESETLCLQLSDLNRMKQEFVEAYDKLFKSTTIELKSAFVQRLKAMQICDEERVEEESN